MRMTLAPLFVLLAATPALAAENVTLKSDVFVQRQVKDAAGKTRIVLAPPAMVTPGDKLVFVLNYKNEGDRPATRFTVTNPIPGAVIYANQASAGELVSADGGRNWGPLGVLKVKTANGAMRPAQAADVTHVKWTLSQPIAAGQSGKLQFQGVVR